MKHTEKISATSRGITLSAETTRTFSLLVSVDMYPLHKSAQTDAVALLYTDALLSGCEGYSREEFLTALSLLGATIDVSIRNDILTISLKSLDTHKNALYALFELMVQKPSFSQTELQRIKEISRNELNESKEDAKAQSLINFINTLYTSKDRRFMTSEDALIEAFTTVTKKELQQFHNQAMSKPWIYTIAGNTNTTQSIEKKLLTLKNTFKKNDTEVFESKENTLTKNLLQTKSIPSKQNIELAIGSFLPCTQNDEDYFAFIFGLQVLGKWGGFAGRLMSTVREKEGLTYGIYATLETATKTHTGYWRIMTFFAPDKCVQGIQSTLREINLIKNKGVTKDEFSRFKNILQTGETLLQDSFMRNALELHSFQLRGFTFNEIAQFKKRRETVTLEEVNSALKKYLTTEKLVFSAAGPVLKVAKELKAVTAIAKLKE